MNQRKRFVCTLCCLEFDIILEPKRSEAEFSERDYIGRWDIAMDIMCPLCGEIAESI